MTAPLLEMRGIAKTFPGVKALKGVELTVWPGEIHALMGENGAGKSTLMRILSGAMSADPGGAIAIDGRPVAIANPIVARALGIAVIYQELSLAPTLSVAENIYMGRELARGAFADRRAMNDGCRDVLARLGAGFGPTTQVVRLSMAERQLVEIARAIHAKARILVMDEPTTALSSRETDKLFALVRQLRAEGLAIIYISHRMAEVYELADRCSVLRDGAYVGTLARDELSAETLVSMMVGRDISGFYRKDHSRTRHDGPFLLEVEGVSDGRLVRDCCFSLRGGEVLGLAGLVGSGRSELALAIYGARPRTAGSIRVAGKLADIRSPGDAIAASLVYLTEDRKGDGVFLDMSVEDNIALGVIDRDAALGTFLDRRRIRARATAAIKALAIRVAAPTVNVGTLSGGNQQKALLSRFLETAPQVLILDEPTRGVDIGAKSEIYRIIDGLAARGAGVVVISSELPEIIGIADRILVMREGRIAGEVRPGPEAAATQEAVMAISTGVAGAV